MGTLHNDGRLTGIGKDEVKRRIDAALKAHVDAYHLDLGDVLKELGDPPPQDGAPANDEPQAVTGTDTSLGKLVQFRAGSGKSRPTPAPSPAPRA